MEILVNVIGQKLKVTTNLKCFISGSQQFVKFIFNIDDSWDNLTTFAQFRQNDVAYNQYLDANNSVYLPSEIGAGACTLILYGTGGNVRATTNYLTLTIDENILVTNAQSTEITQSLYEQLVNSVTTTTNRLQDRVANVENVIQGLAGGAPIVVASTSAMTDTDQIYVLKTDGKWYYHNGSVWVAGGTYGAVATDTTLTQSGIPADAKKVGGEITNLKVDLDHLEEVVEAIEPGLSNEAKQALLVCFEHVAWTDEHGLDYYDVLKAALNGGSVDTLSAVVNLGTHVVYPTDNLQTLRDYLTVYFRSGGTTTEITAYVLQGDITSVGTHVLTITYNNLSTTVNITVEANTTGILYDWDFTKSLTDSRQLQTAVLGTGEAADIPGKSKGTTPPVRNETGIVFSDVQQFARLFSTDIITSDLLKNKTVEVDVASFDLQYTINVSYGMRFLMLSSPDTNGYRVFNCGLAYMRGLNSSYVLGWKPMSGAPDGTLAYPSQPIDTDISIINGHTVGVYFNNDGTIKMYIDGVSKGTSDVSVFAQDGCKGLQIGAGGRPNYGGCFYNALITGVRIYDGDAA